MAKIAGPIVDILNLCSAVGQAGSAMTGGVEHAESQVATFPQRGTSNG